ncbi:MAG: hypothetical protein ACRENE_33210, partial [Polyangiaceae bacterium]
DPLRQLVEVHGPMEQRLRQLSDLFDQGERRFAAYAMAQQMFSRASARVARLRRALSDDHHAAIREVAPLYERLRRETTWVLGASHALLEARTRGLASLDLDRRMGLVGWRTRYLMSDERLRARIAGLVGYAPGRPTIIANAVTPPGQALIPREAVRAALHHAIPVADVLAFVIDTWPDFPLKEKLRVYGQIVCGNYGRAVATDAEERSYAVDGARLEAWPHGLAEVPA